MKKLYNLLKNEKIEYFTFDEIEKGEINSGILILDSKYFNILLITLDVIEDKRERELEIEEYLENYFEDYDSLNYVEKEIVLHRDKNLEKVLILLLKKDIIEEIIENAIVEKIKIEGIYPMFLMEIFNKDEREKEYIDINDENLYIFSFKNNKLVDFQDIDFMREELLLDIEYLKDYLNLNKYIFTYKCQEKNLVADFINIRNWKEYDIFYIKELNFLPLEYREGIEEKRLIKRLICIFSCILLVCTIFSLLFNIYINRNKDLLYKNELKLEELKENIEEERGNILKNQQLLEELNDKNKKEENIKVSSWLIKILGFGKDLVDIRTIEYIGERKVYIEGKVKKREDFYKFQYLLLNKNIFQNMNHDFFKLSKNEYEFKIEGIL